MSVTLDISIGDKSWTQTIPDGATVKAGRSNNAHIHIDDETVSNLHFQLENIPGGWVLKDLRSTNGILVNDEKVSKIALQEGDIITAGNCTIVFHTEPVRVEKSTDTDTRKIPGQTETVVDDEAK